MNIMQEEKYIITIAKRVGSTKGNEYIYLYSSEKPGAPPTYHEEKAMVFFDVETAINTARKLNEPGITIVYKATGGSYSKRNYKWYFNKGSHDYFNRVWDKSFWSDGFIVGEDTRYSGQKSYV